MHNHFHDFEGTNRMHFQPYNWTQIEEILKNRLETSKNLVDKSALQFAARKVKLNTRMRS
jgi:Cdc6-like AAA superfamily ATPase